MKKTVLLLASSFLLVSCNNGGGDKSWTISFESNGGSEVASLTVVDGQKAAKPGDPTRDGYSFLGWYQDQALVTAFDWETAITADWTLYASWDKIETPAPVESSSSEENTSSASSSSGEESASKKGHGPEGSSLVSWYLCGSGSLWDASTGWTTAGGIQLYSNPDNSTDKGCILSIAFAVDDEFKVTDGTNWYGYDTVNQSAGGDVPNAGKTAFEATADSYRNIKCVTAGTYDIYVNSSGTFWIQASN